jgi:hypothetical protein
LKIGSNGSPRSIRQYDALPSDEAEQRVLKEQGATQGARRRRPRSFEIKDLIEKEKSFFFLKFGLKIK